MEKITGKIMEVYADYSIDLKGYNRNPIKATETAKKYISKEDVGKEAEVTIEDNKITFIKVLSGNGEGEDDVLDKIKTTLIHQNWNMGLLQKWSKWNLLSNLDTAKNTGGLTTTQQEMRDLLLKEFEKDKKAIENIKGEQEKNG